MAKIIRLHSVVDDWPILQDVPGLWGYWLRAVMEKGKVVVHTDSGDDDLRLLLSDYNRLGIGPNPNDLIYVKKNSKSLYDDLLQSKDAMEQLRKLVFSDGYKIDLFCASLSAKKFIASAGFVWSEHTLTPTLDTYELWGRKDDFRRLLTKEGFGTIFPHHRIVDTKRDLVDAIDHYSDNGAHLVVAKVPDSASSEGMKFLPLGEMPDTDFMQNHWKEYSGIIVEEAFEHHPFSLTFDLTDSGHSFKFGSLQWQGRKSRIGELITKKQMLEGDLAHRGNVVGPRGHGLGPLPWTVFELAAMALERPLGVIHKTGLRGRICFDFASVNPAKQLALECNPRVSHSNYVDEARKALSRHFGKELCVIAANVSVSENVQTYEVARTVPCNFCFNGDPEGVLFYHTCLLPYGKAGLIAFGETFEIAREHFESAESELKSV